MTALDFERSMMTEVVWSALDEAARRGSMTGRPVNTRDVLVVLAAIDNNIRWSRVGEAFGGLDASASAADPLPAGGDVWMGTPVTDTCATAIRAAHFVAVAYDMDLTGPGILALCLVAEPSTAAATSLAGDDAQRHSQLLAMVQGELVGGDLADVASVLGRCFAAASGRADHRPVEADTTFAERAMADLHDPILAPRRVGGLAFLSAVVRRSDDTELARRLDRLVLDGDWLDLARPMVAELPEDSAATIVTRARARFDTFDPDPAQLIVAATAAPSNAVDRALWYLGVSAKDVALEAATVDAARRTGRAAVSGSAVLLLVGGTVLAAVNSALIVNAAAAPRDWWLLALLPLVWWGHPRASAWVAVGVAGLLCMLVGPVPGLLALACAAADAARSWMQRRTVLQRTGITLSAREWRRYWARERGPGVLMSALRLGSLSRTAQHLLIMRRRDRRVGS